jgi:hypothetical protein
VNGTEQVQYERTVRTRYAVIATVAGALLLISSVLGLIGPQANVNEATLGLIYVHKRAALDLLGVAVEALALLGEALTLNWLWRICRARDESIRPVARWLTVGGALVLGVGFVVYTVANVIAANKFATSTGPQTYMQAQRLTGGIGNELPILIADFGAFALTFGLIWTAVLAMRVGVLTRFLGYTGIIAGVLILFPLIQVPIVEVYWLVALGVLFAGRWPSGQPPAWETGLAVPWNPMSQPRQRPTGGNAPPRPARPARAGAGFGGFGLGRLLARPAPGPAPAPAPAKPVASPEETAGVRTRSNTPKRKRKRRN